MGNKIHISIPKPCGENWNEMTSSKKGKFCSSCQKEIIDFTTYSDREIIKEFDTNKNLCGHFLVNQINRELIIPKERRSIWLAISSSVISFLGIGKQELLAQESVKMEQTDKKIVQNNTLPDSNNIEEIEIEGKIFLDEINPNFEEVEISLYGKNQIFHPYADGKFCIKANKNDTILITKTGYISYHTLVKRSSNLGAIELENNEPQTFVVGGAIAVKRNFWYRLFHKN